MNCIKNSNRYIIAALIAVVMAMTAFSVVADDSSASTYLKDVTADGFMHDKTGTLHVTVNCNDSAGDVVTITVTENGNTLKSEAFNVETSGLTTCDLQFQLSQGTHDLTVTVVDELGNKTSSSITLDVTKSIWSNITTYLAIAALAIIVLVIAVVYMRSNPKNKPTTTFTELEREKNAASSTEPSKASKPTGKIKYESSRRK